MKRKRYIYNKKGISWKNCEKNMKKKIYKKDNGESAKKLNTITFSLISISALALQIAKYYQNHVQGIFLWHSSGKVSENHNQFLAMTLKSDKEVTLIYICFNIRFV